MDISGLGGRFGVCERPSPIAYNAGRFEEGGKL